MKDAEKLPEELTGKLSDAIAPGMNIKEAQKALKDGNKIKHRFFDTVEYVYLNEDGHLMDETGMTINWELFWDYRKNWNSNWSIVGEKQNPKSMKANKKEYYKQFEDSTLRNLGSLIYHSKEDDIHPDVPQEIQNFLRTTNPNVGSFLTRSIRCRKLIQNEWVSRMEDIADGKDFENKKILYVTIKEFLQKGGELKKGRDIYNDKHNRTIIGHYKEYDDVQHIHIVEGNGYKSRPVSEIHAYIKILVNPIYK